MTGLSLEVYRMDMKYIRSLKKTENKLERFPKFEEAIVRIKKGRLCVAAWGVGVVLAMTSCVAQEQRVEWEKHVIEEELVLPEVEGEYDLLFLTDTHAVIQDKSDSEQITENAKRRYAEMVNEEGASAKQQLSDWIDYAVEEQVDAVLMGGDIIDYPSEPSLKFLDEQLGKLTMPYLYTLGNHDWTFPWEYMTDTAQQQYRPLLEPYMSGDTDIHTWENEDLRVIAVDNSSGQVRSEAVDAYEELLDTNKAVIVMVHVPLMTQSVLGRAKEEWDSPVVLGAGNYGGIYPNEDSEEFVELTTAADSPVELVLAGHVHFYDRDYIDGDKQILQIVGDAGFHGSALRLHICGE